jgi:hypothetical protein
MCALLLDTSVPYLVRVLCWCCSSPGLMVVVERDFPLLLNVTRPLSSLSSQLGLFSRSEVVWIHTHRGSVGILSCSLARPGHMFDTTTYYYGGVLGSSRYISLASLLADSISAPSPRD